MATLKDVKVGQSADVAKLTGTGALKRRIMDMGLTKEQLAAIEPVIKAVEDARDDDSESIITSDRYDWISETMAACVVKAPK